VMDPHETKVLTAFIIVTGVVGLLAILGLAAYTGLEIRSSSTPGSQTSHGVRP
jgi:hypothetical protein